MRIVLIGFTVVLVVLSFGLAIRYNQDAAAARNELDGERYQRIVSEEELQKATQKIASLEGDLMRFQSKIETMTAELENVKSFNDDLRTRLDKAAQIKTSLDKQISELQQMVAP